MTGRTQPIRVFCCSARQVRFSFTRVWLLPAVLVAAGCGGASSDTIPVQGKVSYRGEPVTKASVTFFPQSGRPTSAPLSGEGDYEIDLPPGEYQVTISVGLTLPPGWKEGDAVPPPKFVLPPQFTTQAKSTLSASISSDGPKSVDFALD